VTPSVAVAREYAAARGITAWIPEIEAMIADHHKITPAHAHPQSLVESFRRADWIDVSRGLRRFGLQRTFIAAVSDTWPNAGFHRRLVELTIDSPGMSPAGSRQEPPRGYAYDPSIVVLTSRGSTKP
jgi:hypothetical protein